MNKSLLTNILALMVLMVGYYLNNQFFLNAGLFAFSGAITNSLAVHMLFEKVPGLYGSGIIPAQFEGFKASIKDLMMEQFFTTENIDRFLNKGKSRSIPLELNLILKEIDFNPTFDSLIQVISESPFGNMLAMFGEDTLQSLKQPFVKKMQKSMIDITQTLEVKNTLKKQFELPMANEIKENIEKIINQRLDELTPELIKKMVQTIIKKHLGWLVVWGGILGSIIGVISSFFTLI
ncbi:membrane protein [Candidatus Photodesmus blepharus]|uniref:Membrane protein n=1 Tax=Candidatus Photodesmus blepharonis TaxID=1179155 RepID=A0A084CMN7_9GAMM|nr:hypothetical protein [Candidatus Photodesmus blepharus]KEY91066.1 membrane protein [Candidatus Photodesmus blepharus]